MKEKRSLVTKALLRFYLMTVIENLTDYDLKDLLIQKLSQDMKKLALSVTGFLFALTLSAIGLSLTILETGRYLRDGLSGPWLNVNSSSGLVLMGIAAMIFLLIYRFLENRVEEVRQIRSVAHPLQALLGPYMKELKIEQKAFIEEHGLHLPAAQRPFSRRSPAAKTLHK